jgi:hypothetical protein
LEGVLVVQLDVAVVEADRDDVSEGVVAEAQVLCVLVLVLDLGFSSFF